MTDREITLPIYLDHQASTPMDGSVLEAMLPWFRTAAESSARHDLGFCAYDAVEKARDQVASLIGCSRSERVIFTSGATEASNMALRGLGLKAGSRCVTSTVEHACVRETLGDLRRTGIEVVDIPVDGTGLVDMDRLREAIVHGPALVTLMAVNDQVGTIQPFREVAALCDAANVLFHSDMAQALGRIPVDVRSDTIDMASFSAHKMGGPQGVGALYVADHVLLHPCASGGRQERGLRPGSVPTALVVGFGAACALARRTMGREERRISQLRDRFLGRLREAGVEFEVVGSLERRVAANLSLRLPGTDALALARYLFDVCIATGVEYKGRPAPRGCALAAMGLRNSQRAEVIRVGFGRTTTADEVDFAAERIGMEVNALRIRAAVKRSRQRAAPERIGGAVN